MMKNDNGEKCKKCLTSGNTKSIMKIRSEEVLQMAKMGRPKVDKPIDHVVTVKFREEEYRALLEYAQSHNLSISHILRLGVEMQIKDNQK